MHLPLSTNNLHIFEKFNTYHFMTMTSIVMIRPLRLPLFVLFTLIAVMSSAQSLLETANKQFELKAFELAIQNYKDLLDSDPQNIDVQLRIAESYNYLGDPIEALVWYKKNESSMDLHDNLNYANTLKNTGKYKDARLVYNRMMENHPEVAQYHLSNIDFAIDRLKENEKYDLRLFKLNSKTSDFGASLYGDKLVYCSFEGEKDVAVSQSAFNNLYISDKLDPALNGLHSKINFDTNASMGIGPVSYTSDLKTAAYTSNRFLDGRNFIYPWDVDMAIYFSDVTVNGQLETGRSFSHNEIGSSTGFPYLTADGQELYFASNRDGGYGGYDLYRSLLVDGNGQLQKI